VPRQLVFADLVIQTGARIFGLPVPSAPDEAARKAEVDAALALAATKVDGATPPVVDGAVVVFSGTTGKQIRMGAPGGQPPVVQGPITGSGLSMNSLRILGRTTIGVGPIEEITVGTGLSFGSGILSSLAPVLATTPPAPLGTAFVGTGTTAARSDHVHRLPTPAELGVPITGPITGSGQTMATNRLLGRASAGTGAIEEIALGLNLSFVSGALTAATTGDVFGPAVSVDGGAVVFDGVTGKLLKAGSGPPVVQGPVTGSGLTMPGGKKLLGRETTGVGAVEVISLGSGMTMVGGVLDALGSVSDNVPSDLGVAAPGVGTTASRFDHVHRIPTAAELGAVRAGLVVGSGLTMNSAKLAGRSYPGTGGIEEVSVGTGLLLSGGVLSATGGGGGGGGNVGDIQDPPLPGNPVGYIVWLIRDPANPPSGYLYCGGNQVSRTTYFDLYTAVGDTYGAGNGLTTFNLPLEANLTNPYGPQYNPFIKFGVKLGSDTGIVYFYSQFSTTDLGAYRFILTSSASIPSDSVGISMSGTRVWAPAKDGYYCFVNCNQTNGSADQVRFWKLLAAGNYQLRPQFLTNIPVSGLVVQDLAVSPDGNWLAVAYNAQGQPLLPDFRFDLYSIDRATDTVTYVSTFNYPKVNTGSFISQLTWVPNSTGFIYSDSQQSGLIRVIRRTNGTLSFNGNITAINGLGKLSFSPDGKWLLVSYTGQIFAWNGTSLVGTSVAHINWSPANLAEWISDVLIVCSAGSGQSVWKWNGTNQTYTLYVYNLVVAGVDIRTNAPILRIPNTNPQEFAVGINRYRIDDTVTKYSYVDSNTGVIDFNGSSAASYFDYGFTG
jgi:hypothetical protein